MMGHLLSFEKAAPGRVLCTKTPAEVHASVIGHLFYFTHNIVVVLQVRAARM